MAYKKPLGVADNKTYKDMYHFNNRFFGEGGDPNETPSINDELKINDAIKENPYSANVEIEKDEIVLQPDLTGLFIAKGKSHKQGGIDVSLRPNSFVFSDDKSLALTPRECELFELKKGGKSHLPQNYTPAQVIRKNVKPEDYNRLVSNISDVKKGDLTKKSSAMMLEKYIDTLGGVAYLQEKKKDFPQGLPDFSIGSAPVKHPELDALLDESYQFGNKPDKQYTKYGGKVENPYKAQLGVNRPPMGSRLYDTKGWTKIEETDEYIQYKKTSTGEVKIVQKDGPKMSDADWTKFINSPQGKATRHLRQTQQTATDYGFQQKPLELLEAEMSPMLGLAPRAPMNPLAPPDFTTPTPTPQVPELDVTPQGVKRADWQFTPWQRVSKGYNLAKLASARRYMPMRSQVDSPVEEAYLVNPEQTVGDLKALANQQISALGTLNPILRNAQAASAYGQLQNQIPQVRNQYDNANQQIVQGVRQRNAAAQTRDEYQNKAYDQQYYKESIVGRQNFDNMRAYLGDQYMNNVLRDVETNQALAYNLLTLNNPAYGYDWKTGNFYRNKKDILDVQGSGAQDEYRSLIQLADQIGDPVKKLELLTKIHGLRVFGPAISAQNNSPFRKKGGTVRNPYKKY